MKTTLILGAGFSKNSGIPIQSEIPAKIINQTSDDDFENAVTLILNRFFRDVFGSGSKGTMPALDDIFTCIDISTNSGHHLGIGYSPAHLRAIRRMLVYRVFSILERNFIQSEDVTNLISILSKDCYQTGYVVLNWDTVAERYLKSVFPETRIDYCNGAVNWDYVHPGDADRTIRVIKIHGSTNWLYCDNCRALFHDMNNKFTLEEKAGFQENDFMLFEELSKIQRAPKLLNSIQCRICKNPVSSHIATFSFRKTFRSNSFPNIWEKAEEELAASDRWIFIGYSLPSADYEFKHLVKIAQLKLEHVRKNRVAIDVVLLNSHSAVDRYKSFFGERLNLICNEGIKGYISRMKHC